MSLEWKDVAGWLWVLLGFPLRWIWNRVQADIAGKASKEALKVVADDAKETAESLHNLRNRAVTLEAVRERKEEVDKQLEARRQDVISIYNKMEEHAKSDQEIHNELLRELRGIGSAVARIEGRLEK